MISFRQEKMVLNFMIQINPMVGLLQVAIVTEIGRSVELSFYLEDINVLVKERRQ